MNNIKLAIANKFRCALSMISPRLNTEVTYFMKFKKKLNLSNPRTLNEKILWLKFNTYWNNEEIKQCADKYRVREYLEERGFGEILNPIIGVYENVDEINWSALPNSFALKLNVGCGNNIIVNDKSELDISKIKKELKKWLKSEYWKEYSEMQYKGVKKCIIIEEYLGGKDGSLPKDYKFYCLNGKSCYVMVCDDRVIGKEASFFYFDNNWRMMPYSQDALDNPNRIISKPEKIEEAFDYAEKLAKNFPFVRVDLYIVNGKIYFGEFTFTPSAGLDNGRLESTDLILGDMLVLPV